MAFRSSINRVRRAALGVLAASLVLTAMPASARMEEITAAVLTDFPPLYLTDAEGKPEGFAIDILKSVSQDAGLAVHYLPVKNWAEAMQAVREGRADLVPGIGISQPRAGEFVFSSEIETVPVSWFVRRESSQFSSVADLVGRPVAVIAESAAATRLNAQGNHRLVPYETLELALFALLAGNVDALVFPEPVLLKKARDIDVEERVRVVGPPLMELKRGFMYRTGDTALRDRLEPHIRAFTRSNAYLQDYHKWYGKPAPFWTPTRVFWTMLALAGTLLIGVLASRYVAIARLNLRLKESEERHRTYVENAPEGVFVADRMGRYLDVNPSACAMTGYEREELLGMSIADLAPPGMLPEHLNLYEEVKRQGSLDLELTLRRKDGSEIFVIIRAIVLPGKRVMGLCSDISERKLAGDALRRERETLQLILDYAPIGIWLQDGNGKLAFVNKAFCDATGIPEARFLAVPHYVELIPEGFRAQFMESDAKALAGEGISATRQRLPFVDGRVHDLHVIKAVKRDAQGNPQALIGLSLDITEELAREQALHDSEERLRLALDAANQAWFEVDLRSGSVAVSPEYPRMIGYTPDRFATDLGNWIANIHPDDKQAMESAFAACVKDGGPHTMDYRRRTASDNWKWMRSVGKVVQWDEAGRALRLVGIHTDITQIKEHERQLEHIAHYDALTGLPNRLLLADRLHQAMAQALRRSQRLAVAYLDLDGFKTINDNHGHDVGDRLLTALAERMKHALREGDTLARLGGDEFVSVLLDLTDIESCVPMLTRLLTAAAEVVHDRGLALRVSASLGVTFYPQVEEVDADQLLRQADQAMYQAKLAGKNRYHIFDTEHDRTVRGHHESLERIRRGLADGEFLLYYQPKVNMRSGEVVGVEALIRWLHPDRGVLPPAVFLPVVDGHPLAISLGDWVLDTAMAQFEAWKAAGLVLPVSVNIDALQLQSPGFVDSLRRQLAAHPGVTTGDLELEVLETSALGDISQVSRVIEACRDMGVGFALDDFGTGYSSLTYLKRLPANLLKIDQSFVHDMLDDPDDLAILEGILGLASAFRRRAIAEGVESVAHGEMLLRLGCDLGQGYQIARPMPAGDIPGWLATWEAHPSWKNTPPINRDNLPILFAMVELQAWAATVEAHLTGSREMPPLLGDTPCRYADWLAQYGQSRRSGEPAFQSALGLHGELRDLAIELASWTSRGQVHAARMRIGEVHRLKDQLLASLLALL